MTIGATKKSVQITNMDLTPDVRTTAGEGGPDFLQDVDGYVIVAAADAAGTLYLLNRVKSYAKVKSVVIASEAQGAGKIDVGVYYADDVRYLAPGNTANAGAVILINAFATDIDLTSKLVPTDEIFQNGSFTFDKMAQPLWQALGLATDPGGFFDIVATVHTTDVTTGTGKLYCRTRYAG